MSLSSADANDLTRQVAELAAGGMPLAAGLRASADEATSSSLAASLRGVSADLERGRSLDDSLAAASDSLPPHIAGLVRAGVRSGRLGRVLLELAQQQRVIADAHASIYGALAYPAILFAISLVMLLVEVWWLIPMMRGALGDWDTELPPAVQMVFWLSDTGVPFFLWIVAGLIGAALVARLALGGARWQWMLSSVPIFGPLWHDSGTAEFALLLGILLEEQVPMPEALRLAGDGLSDASLAAACQELAGDVERGKPLSAAVAECGRFPLSLAPLLEYGERTGTLDDALRTAGEMFLGRVKLRSALLATVLPPVAFLMLASSGFLLFAAVVLPLMSMIRMLSF